MKLFINVIIIGALINSLLFLSLKNNDDFNMINTHVII